MQYNSLHDLITNSRSSRKYFLSQSVPMQRELHKHGANIHSLAQLHAYVDMIQKHNRSVEISEMLFKD